MGSSFQDLSTKQEITEALEELQRAQARLSAAVPHVVAVSPDGDLKRAVLNDVAVCAARIALLNACVSELVEMLPGAVAVEVRA